MKKFITCILLICSLAMLTACPARSDLVKAYRASASVAGYTETAVEAVGSLFEAKVISYEAKEKLVEKLKIVAKNGRRFHETVKGMRAAYGETLPDKEVNALDIVFNREVIKPFVELLTEAGLLNESASGKVLAALSFIKQAVLTVARLFQSMRPGQSASHEFLSKQEAINANG